MRRIAKAGLIAWAATALTATVAGAADLDLPAPVIEHNPVAVGGFYLRGDIGFSIWKDPDLAFRNDVAGFSSPFDNENAQDAFLFGAGIGYKFNRYLRFDLTADHRTNKRIDGTIQCGTCATLATIGQRTLGQETTLDLSTFFANAYLDLGTYNRFTPYVGGGVGGALLNYSTYISSNNPTAANTPGADPADLLAANPSGIANQLFNGNNDFRFAWNVQAGASYDLTDNLAIDGSYRYTRINDGTVAQIGGTGAVVSDDLVGHELRLGVRYTFGSRHSDFAAPEPIFK